MILINSSSQKNKIERERQAKESVYSCKLDSMSTNIILVQWNDPVKTFIISQLRRFLSTNAAWMLAFVVFSGSNAIERVVVIYRFLTGSKVLR